MTVLCRTYAPDLSDIEGGSSASGHTPPVLAEDEEGFLKYSSLQTKKQWLSNKIHSSTVYGGSLESSEERKGREGVERTKGEEGGRLRFGVRTVL